MTNHYATENTHITLADLHPFYTYSCSVAAETIYIGPFTAELTTQMPEDGKYNPNFFSLYSSMHAVTMLSCSLTLSTSRFATCLSHHQQ